MTRPRRRASCASRRAIASRAWRAGLRAMGAEIEEFPDGFHLRGAAAAPAATVDAADDHRLAMAFAIAATRRRGPTTITGASVGRRLVSGVLRRARAAHAVTADKIYLVGFMAAGKTTVARALAARLGWRAEDVDELIEARERRTVADIFARARRAVLPGASSARSCSCCCPLRHLVVATGGGTFVDPDNRAAINLDGAVGLARRAVRRRARAAAGRRPAAARRRPRPDGAAVRRAAASPTRRRTCASTPAARTPRQSSSGSWTASTQTGARCSTRSTDSTHGRYLVLSDIHANLDALEAVLASVDGAVGPRCSSSATSSATAPSRTTSSIASARSNPVAIIRGNHDKAACGIEDGSNFNQVAQHRGDVDRSRRSPPRTAIPPRAAGRARDDRRPRRDLPRRAVRRGPLHLRRRRRAARAGDQRRASSACSATRTCRWSSTTDGRDVRRVTCRRRTRRSTIALQAGARYLVNAGSVGPAARRRPARGLRHLRRRTALTLELRRVAYPVDAAQRRILVAGLPASLANRLAVGR